VTRAARPRDSSDTRTAESWLGEKLYRAHPRQELHVILGNLRVHKHQEVLAWAARRRRLTLHFTPTYASWLNQVEIRFNIFARDVLKVCAAHPSGRL